MKAAAFLIIGSMIIMAACGNDRQGQIKPKPSLAAIKPNPSMDSESDGKLPYVPIRWAKGHATVEKFGTSSTSAHEIVCDKDFVAPVYDFTGSHDGFIADGFLKCPTMIDGRDLLLVVSAYVALQNWTSQKVEKRFSSFLSYVDRNLEGICIQKPAHQSFGTFAIDLASARFSLWQAGTDDGCKPSVEFKAEVLIEDN